MPRFSLLQLALLTSSATAAPDLVSRFEEFKKKHGKSYASADEELQRFRTFVDNMERVDKQQKTESGDAVYSHLSPLADLSMEEFSKMNNMLVTKHTVRQHEEKAKQIEVNPVSLPDSFDWISKGAVTPVKNQGMCGSCWAFGTVASIEGNNFVSNGKLISLSEQELVDCAKDDHGGEHNMGCGGGLPSWAYQDLITEKMGLELETAYPYHGRNMKCAAKPSLEKIFLGGWVAVKKDEDQIAAALMQYGPLAIGVNAGPMQFYMGGIADPWFCDPNGIDHAVTLTGFGEGTTGWFVHTKKKYWSIKNSWGGFWGEKGYYRLVRGKGKCGMNLVVTAAEVAKPTENAEVYV